MTETILEIKHLKKSYGENQVLKDISLTVRKGEVISIIGSSGSGKSTFLRSINLLEIPSAGEIIYKGQNVLEPNYDLTHYREKLGMVFLQLHDNFKPKDAERLEKFVEDWPKEVPLAIELRNGEWFSDEEIFNKTMDLFEKYKITNIIVDTAGRRDMLHMRLTTPVAFVRYVGANAESDYTRLDDWVKRIKVWEKEGLEKLYFFVHQNIEKASPLLSAYFIEKINSELGVDIHIPQMADPKTKF